MYLVGTIIYDHVWPLWGISFLAYVYKSLIDKNSIIQTQSTCMALHGDFFIMNGKLEIIVVCMSTVCIKCIFVNSRLLVMQ